MSNKETKELFQFLVAFLNASAKVIKNGKIDFWHILDFVPVFKLAPAAIDNVEGILAEVQTWTPAEEAEIHALIKAIDLPDDAKEASLENILNTIVSLAKYLPLLNVLKAGGRVA